MGLLKLMLLMSVDDTWQKMGYVSKQCIVFFILAEIFIRSTV